MTERRVSHHKIKGPNGIIAVTHFAPDVLDGPDMVEGAGRVRAAFDGRAHDHRKLLDEADRTNSHILIAAFSDPELTAAHYPPLLSLAGWLIEEAEHLGLDQDRIHFEDGAADMKQVVRTIDINAPAQDVWAVFTGFDKYPEWNPYVLDAKAELNIGGDIHLKLQNAGEDKPFRITAIIDAIDAPRHFGWRGKVLLPGLMDTHHHFTIEERSDGTSRFIHTEAFSGLLGGVVFSLVEKTLEKTFDGMNAALKMQVEG